MDHEASRDSTLLTVHETAARLRSSEYTIRRMIRAGHLPALRVGSQYRIDSDELERWLFSDEPESHLGESGGRSLFHGAAADRPPAHRRGGDE